MTAATMNGLVKFEGQTERKQGESWRGQMDMAASCLAVAALQGGMPRVAASFGNEKQLASYLSDRVWQKRRVEALKFLVVTLAEVIGVAAGLYIGTLT